MSWIVSNVKWIMLVSGALTCSMIYAAIAPQAALRSSFGDSLEGPVAEIVVRNWGALITLVGAMLIYGAFVPAVRALILVVSALSKVIFISLVLVHGREFLADRVGVSIVADSVMVLLFMAYLAGVRRSRSAA